jgi:hypothetical protein
MLLHPRLSNEINIKNAQNGEENGNDEPRVYLVHSTAPKIDFDITLFFSNIAFLFNSWRDQRDWLSVILWLLVLK